MTREEKQKAIDALKTSAPIREMTQEEFNDYIKTLNKIMDWLEQEPCEDAISRQALLDDFGFSEKTRKWGGDHSGYNTLMLYEIQDVIEAQPPVNPQESKLGHWITEDRLHPKCDQCGWEYGLSMTNFCPNCGARMIEPQESEVSNG